MNHIFISKINRNLQDHVRPSSLWKGSAKEKDISAHYVQSPAADHRDDSFALTQVRARAYEIRIYLSKAF